MDSVYSLWWLFKKVLKTCDRLIRAKLKCTGRWGIRGQLIIKLQI